MAGVGLETAAGRAADHIAQADINIDGRRSFNEAAKLGAADTGPGKAERHSDRGKDVHNTDAAYLRAVVA